MIKKIEIINICIIYIYIYVATPPGFFFAPQDCRRPCPLAPPIGRWTPLHHPVLDDQTNFSIGGSPMTEESPSMTTV